MRTPLLLFTLIMLAAAVLVMSQSSGVVISVWNSNNAFDVARRAIFARPAPASGAENPAPAGLSATMRRVVSTAGSPGWQALQGYNQASRLVEATSGGEVAYYTRDLAGGSLHYFVVLLDERVHFQVINADGATPGSDASGDTVWTDGKKHLATVQQMVAAPYAARPGATLMGAMAFGFHGAARTSNEGTVVINGAVHRVNPWRAALCLGHDGTLSIGLFDAQAVGACVQAIGGGPVILWDGKIASPAVTVPDDEFLPFNPLGEDFVQLDWRKKIYTGSYPKTAVGIGTRDDGRPYLVMAVSYGLTGVDLAAQFRAMGCRAALGGDDDTSTQAVWRGAPLIKRQVRAVPDAIAVYYRP